MELYEAVSENTNENIKSDANERYVPTPLPVKTILPEFNSMAYFVVEPGKSFHSVQEVFCDRPRLSIQGEIMIDALIELSDSKLNKLPIEINPYLKVGIIQNIAHLKLKMQHCKG